MTRQLLREALAYLRQHLIAHLSITLLFIGCFFGVSLSMTAGSSNSYALGAYLGVVGRSLVNGHVFQNDEDVIKALEAGLKTKDRYLKLFYTEDEYDSYWSSLSLAVPRKYGIVFDHFGRVQDVLKHSPAYGDIVPGDIITKVGSVSQPSKFLETFNRSPEAGVTISRDGNLLPKTLRPFDLKPFYGQIDGDTATATVYFFRSEMIPSAREFLATVDANPLVKKLVFDVTQCPGGQVSALDTLLGSLFADRKVLYMEKRGTKRYVHVANGKEPVLDVMSAKLSLEIRKSKRTASAAEIFIGVMQHHLDPTGKLSIIGDTTYGKWTTTAFTKFLRGGMMRSIGAVVLPDGKTYEGLGL